MTYRMVLSAMIFLAVVSIGLAEDDPAIYRKLDKPLSISLDQTPIDEVLAALERLSGLDFDVDEDVWAFLPYGRETQLSMSLDSVSLRRALPAVLGKQGLTYEVVGSEVIVTPAPPLYRLARRATFDEFKLLGEIMTHPVNTPAESIDRLLGRVQAKPILPGGFDADDRASARTRANQAVPTTLGEWLTFYAGSDELTWYVQGQSVIFLPADKQVQRQLQRVVSLRYQNRKLAHVLMDLAGKAHIRLDITPGVMNLLPATTRDNFSLIMADATIDQALQVIAGSTGLEFQPTVEGLLVKPSLYLEVASGNGPGRSRRPGFLIERTIPGADGEDIRVLLIPEGVSDPLQQAVDADRDRAMDRIERHYGVK